MTQPEKQEKSRTLYEIALDAAAHTELFAGSSPEEQRESVRAILDLQIHDTLNRQFTEQDMTRNFKGVLRYLKEQLRPVQEAFDAYSDVDLRRIIGTEIAWQIQNSAQNPETRNPEDLQKNRDDYVFEVTYGENPLTDPESPQTRMSELVTYLRSWAEFPAFGFGIPALDNATGGILPGEICVITGAPGTMKTSLALSAVDDYVSRTKDGVAVYCSVDMAPRDISLRLLERESGIPAITLRGRPETQDRELVLKKYNNRLAITGHEPGRWMTVNDLFQKCMKRQAQLVVIDYLTRLKPPGGSDLEFVEGTMPAILDFAHRFETSFIVLSQMSRVSRSEQAAGRVGGHGKGGGIVEELASTEIELVQQPDENGGKPLVIACVTKARRGIAGQFFSLGYDGPVKKFDGSAQKMLRSVQRKAIFEPEEKSFY